MYAIRGNTLFQVFIKKIINFVNNPLTTDENLYSRKQLYCIILPSLALVLFLAKTILGFILEKIFGVDFIVSHYYYSDSYLGNLDKIIWLIFPLKEAIKESFAYFFFLSRQPKHFFIGAVLILCFTIAELSINASQQTNIALSWYIFRYLMLVAICIGLVNLFEKKLKKFFRKVTPYFKQFVLASCLLYWIYSSIQFDPHQTPLIAIMFLNLRFLFYALILSWIRMRYSFRDLLLFSTLINISYYLEILVIIVNLFNILRYRKDIIRNSFIDFKTIFK